MTRPQLSIYRPPEEKPCRATDVLTSLLTPSRDVWTYAVLKDIDLELDLAGVPDGPERSLLAVALAEVVEKYRGSILAEER